MKISSTETIILLVGALMWLIGARSSRKQKKSLPKSSLTAGRPLSPVHRQQQNSASISRLTGACFGDRAKADRLVEYEKKRAPGITHGEAILRAIERLEADRS